VPKGWFFLTRSHGFPHPRWGPEDFTPGLFLVVPEGLFCKNSVKDPSHVLLSVRRSLLSTGVL